MSTTYIDLVNKLRDRFNEPHITSAAWSTVVGFDQYTKDAINYAYHDILNAEMEWPFLHRDGSFLTVPGTQLYDVSTADEYQIKEIDWDSFYININVVTTIVTDEVRIIGVLTHTVTPVNSTTWATDLGVKYASTGIDFQSVDYDPQTSGQYTIKDGIYYFNSLDAGITVHISYTTAANSTINLNSTQFLPYISYDEWKQIRIYSDFNAAVFNGYTQPRNVFKTQKQGQLGLTPVPDKIYSVNFEYWLDADDLLNTSDTTLLPVRYEQVLLDCASKYCYEFREDTPLAKSADERYLRGIGRMRTELINRTMDLRSGFRWKYAGGFYS